MFDESAELVTEESVNGGQSSAERDARERRNDEQLDHRGHRTSRCAMFGIEVELTGKGAKIQSIAAGAPSAEVLQIGDVGCRRRRRADHGCRRSPRGAGRFWCR